MNKASSSFQVRHNYHKYLHPLDMLEAQHKPKSPASSGTRGRTRAKGVRHLTCSRTPRDPPSRWPPRRPADPRRASVSLPTPSSPPQKEAAAPSKGDKAGTAEASPQRARRTKRKKLEQLSGGRLKLPNGNVRPPMGTVDRRLGEDSCETCQIGDYAESLLLCEGCDKVCGSAGRSRAGRAL